MLRLMLMYGTNRDAFFRFYAASARAKWRTHAGFTLIETLVAIFIVAILVAFYGVGVMTLSFSREAAHRNVAIHAASEYLEALRTAGYAALPSSGIFSNTQITSLPGGAASTTVTVLNAETKQVTVFVSWQESGRGERSVSLSTLITETGGLP